MTDFPRAEYEARLEAANRAMHINNLDAILLASRGRGPLFHGISHTVSGKAPHALGL
jgi:hypothetical protein